MDRLSKEHRSWNMSRIRARNTAPELIVRSILHKMGYRFRLHRRDLPGRPDIILSRHRLAIFVHGCFWHRHPGCRYAYTPKSNTVFWRKKFEANVGRDHTAARELRKRGWRVAVIWECRIAETDTLRRRLTKLIRGGSTR